MRSFHEHVNGRQTGLVSDLLTRERNLGGSQSLVIDGHSNYRPVRNQLNCRDLQCQWVHRIPGKTIVILARRRMLQHDEMRSAGAILEVEG